MTPGVEVTRNNHNLPEAVITKVQHGIDEPTKNVKDTIATRNDDQLVEKQFQDPSDVHDEKLEVVNETPVKICEPMHFLDAIRHFRVQNMTTDHT